MPLGVADFEFEQINLPYGADDLASGNVRFRFDDVLGEAEVTHHVLTTVRVKAPRTSTIEELQQILLEAAVAQLRRALSRVEGKNALQLGLEVEDKLRRDQEELDRPIGLG